MATALPILKDLKTAADRRLRYSMRELFTKLATCIAVPLMLWVVPKAVLVATGAVRLSLSARPSFSLAPLMHRVEQGAHRLETVSAVVVAVDWF